MKKALEAAVLLIGALGWWGFVYPELCLTEGAYVQEAQAGQMENIRIKSRIAEYLFEDKTDADMISCLTDKEERLGYDK